MCTVIQQKLNPNHDLMENLIEFYLSSKSMSHNITYIQRKKTIIYILQRKISGRQNQDKMRYALYTSNAAGI